jgi:integrase
MSNGFGGVVKLGGNRRKPYGARITTGWKDGKQQYQYIGYFEDRDSALVALANYHTDPYRLEDADITFADMYTKWKESREDELTKDNSYAYDGAFKNSAMLHDYKFVEIRSEHLKKCMKACEKSHATKSKMKQLWNQMYQYALENDLKVTNYSQFVKVKSEAPKNKNIFTREELDALWKEDTEITDIAIILLYTGMRIGELLAIEIENINLEERYMVGGLKTEAGIDRVIPIHERIVPVIEKYMQNRIQYLFEFNNEQLKYQTVLIRWRKWFGKTHKMHDTRKTFISWMHEKDVPIEIIRVIVGHAGQGVTEQRYLATSVEKLVKTVNVLD